MQDIDIDLVIGLGTAAAGTGTLAYVLLRAVFSGVFGGDGGQSGGSGVRALLALPATFIARRRTLDLELQRKLDQLEKLRVKAGGRFLEGASAPEIFAAKFVFPALAIAAVSVVFMLLRLPSGGGLLIALFFAVLLYVWPETGLKSAAALRSAKFVADLPMVLDVMRLVSQSGGDLYSSIQNAIAVTAKSPVKEELIRAVNEVAIGTSLAKALTNVADRVDTPDATAVFSTLAQSLEMGTSVSDNLMSASSLMRHSARVRAQARAQKAVVAMSFPLLLLILPGVFIVLFAPMIIQFMNK